MIAIPLNTPPSARWYGLGRLVLLAHNENKTLEIRIGDIFQKDATSWSTVKKDRLVEKAHTC